MKTSFGVVLFNDLGQLLMAHATGQNYWDIPKGGADEGEAPVSAAARELQEETGIVLGKESLRDLGRFKYLPGKQLHLFLGLVNTGDVDIEQCECTSFFPHYRTGALTREVDEFSWVNIADVPAYANKSMLAVLRTLSGFEALRTGR